MFAFIFLNSYFTSSLAIYLSHPSGLSCHRRKGQKKHFWAIDPWKSKSKITSNEKRIHFTACWTTTGKDQRFLAAIDGIFRIKKGRIKREIKHMQQTKKPAWVYLFSQDLSHFLWWLLLCRMIILYLRDGVSLFALWETFIAFSSAVIAIPADMTCSMKCKRNTKNKHQTLKTLSAVMV